MDGYFQRSFESTSIIILASILNHSYQLRVILSKLNSKGQRSFHFGGQRSYLSDLIGLFNTLARDTAGQFTQLKRLQHIRGENVFLDFEECSEF